MTWTARPEGESEMLLYSAHVPSVRNNLHDGIRQTNQKLNLRQN